VSTSFARPATVFPARTGMTRLEEVKAESVVRGITPRPRQGRRRGLVRDKAIKVIYEERDGMVAEARRGSGSIRRVGKTTKSRAREATTPDSHIRGPIAISFLTSTLSCSR
jgi:hypothetical protein